MRIALGVLQRLAGFALVFIGVTFIIYVAVFSLPGDPIRALAGDRQLPQSVVDAINAKYLLDQPLWVQYTNYLGNLLQGDLGLDLTGRAVADKLAARWPVTITLALTAWLIQVVLGLAVGIVSALKNGTVIDKGLLVITIGLSCIPVFVLGITAQIIFGVRLDWLPVAGISDGWPLSYLLPSLVIAAIGLASVSRLVRGSMIENLEADYVRTARAKGIGEGRVVGLHVMRNSLIPTATFLATDLGFLLGGTVVIEGIFNLPGVGNLLFTAIRDHEAAMVVGISTALIVIFLLTSLLVDAIHALLDPRIRRA
ncbi:ABC transporter permease [Microbacterium aerolatum]|uniref:Putative dipeptide-transport integral membrane protein ABC transporter DppB n=1 Tax=Microbacterium aerolatum TaxID=153731 RepID=A0A511AC69_9MICO|nr:ABC transporter permease [Microbacterium aerolatum]MCK3769130.1 ABC transporter permease [Microbacterium aerolatum]GEK85768.1 putative dipeptide-transport integral membrane protein ABC transporter DppB [Microbacterium aerolatum]GGB20492.1 putative dipeptide-transport integral membrane protein ABC transporter DppB [Microbacterium aerolatum]